VKAVIPLLFDWPSRHSVNLALPAMLVVSVLAHVAGIAAFRMQAPQPPSRQHPAEVFILRPAADLPAGSLAAMEAADPSLFSAAASETRELWNLRPTEYSPTFDRPGGIEALIGFRPMPGETAAASRPRPVPMPPPSPKSEPARRGTGSRLVVSGELGAHELPVPVTPEGGESLRPAEFFLVADPDGRIVHAVLLESSGSEAADRAATAWLLRTGLPPAGRTVADPAVLVWGTSPAGSGMLKKE